MRWFVWVWVGLVLFCLCLCLVVSLFCFPRPLGLQRPSVISSATISIVRVSQCGATNKNVFSCCSLSFFSGVCVCYLFLCVIVELVLACPVLFHCVQMCIYNSNFVSL